MHDTLFHYAYDTPFHYAYDTLFHYAYDTPFHYAYDTLFHYALVNKKNPGQKNMVFSSLNTYIKSAPISPHVQHTQSQDADDISMGTMQMHQIQLHSTLLPQISHEYTT